MHKRCWIKKGSPEKMLGNMDEAVTAAKSQSATHLHTQSTRVTCRAGPLPWASEEVGVVAISLHSQGSLGMGPACACVKYFGREIVVKFHS